MIKTRRATALALVFLVAGCGVASVDVPSPEAPPEGTPAEVPVGTAEGSAGVLLLPTGDRLDAIAAGAGQVELPEGSFPLGYVPTPVELPQLPADDLPWSVLGAALPTRYDLRAEGKLSPVRDQGACGSCWAFASYASSESGLRPSAAWDFSEEHLNLGHGFDIKPCSGGNSHMSTAYMARGSGPAAEADAPYTGSATRPLPSAQAKRVLTETRVLPDRTGPTDNDTLKTAIRDHGAVYTSMYWSAISWKGATAAFYDPGPRRSANHAVALVGWNDEYPRTSFAKVPPTNGAFLVRNSWGTGFGDAGYFWISYHDVYIGRDNVAFAGFAAPGASDVTYQLDRFGLTSALSYASSTASSANVYTTVSAAEIQSVGFWTAQPNTTVKVAVYEAPAAAGAPASGKLLGTREVAEPWAGYHTVAFDGTRVQVGAKKKFAVVVQIAAVGKQVLLPVEAPFTGYSSKVVATAGTSYVTGDGKTWTDTANTWRANAPLKAFVKNVPDCDDKNICTTDSWDGQKCVNAPVAKGTVCRASAGPCDSAEVCDGTGAACPADVFVNASTTCRASVGVCDVAEACDGKTAACPSDKFVAVGTVCRQAAGVCDAAETCTGKAAACPANGYRARGTICRAASGVCDLAESCSGTTASCPNDAVAPKGKTCATKKVCDGTSKTCP